MASCVATRTILATTSCCRVRNSRSITSSSGSASTGSTMPRPTVSFSSGAAIDVVWLRGPSADTARAVTTRTAAAPICRSPSAGSGIVAGSLSRNPSSPIPSSRTHSTLVGMLPPLIPVLPTAPLPTCSIRGTSGRSDVLMLASAAAAVLAYSLNFVGATTASGGDATAASSTFGRVSGGGGGGGGSGGGGGGANGGSGGGAGGGSGPSTKAAFASSTVITKAKAEEEVRKWEEDASRYPYKVSDSAVQGERWTMEDAYTVANGGHFAAVYDGHGGDAVSGMLRDRLHHLYTKALPQRHYEEKKRLHDVSLSVPSVRSHITALRGALKRIERDVLGQDDLEYQGSTAVVVIVHVDEDGQRSLLSANIGDSRAVLSRGGKAVDLTRDHKPNDERERARIRSMGEDVEWDPYGELYRVRDLSLSRAIGDRFAKPVVTSEAEIDCIPVIEDVDEFFVLASDGLWDVMSSQEVVNFVRDNMRGEPAAHPNLDLEEKRRKMARMVANEALERGSADNVCVILVWL